MLNYIADILLIKRVRYLESSIVCKLKQMIAIVKIGNIDRTQFGSPFWLYNKGCRNKSFLEKIETKVYMASPVCAHGSIIQAPSLLPHDCIVFDSRISRSVPHALRFTACGRTLRMADGFTSTSSVVV